ncbi:MAG: primosomal protein N', partial [Bacilli bacterium]|nr:primosomal protein N' [Bacilli bacterium]
FNPDHYAISCSKNHDYFSFYKQEMFLRKQLNYPPFYYLCNIRISGKDSSYIELEASKIKKSLEKNLLNVTILGPSSAGIFKMNNIYRYHILLKYKDVNYVLPVLERMIEHYKLISKIKIDIDFNPSQIL